jgi:molecular chaperone IbpA
MTLHPRVQFGQLLPSTVGFDRFFDAFDGLSADKFTPSTFPPHNIVKIDDNNYLVELAVAGFSDEDISIEVVKNQLEISGKKTEKDANRSYLHQGIGTRSFKKTVHMAATVQVKGASLADGILTVELENVIPEENLPKRIPIASGGKNKVLSSGDGKKKLLQE